MYIDYLVNTGLVLLPLVKGGKKPLIRWKRYQTEYPGALTIKRWFANWSEAEIGVLTSDHSGIICLDCDAPPYPESGEYYDTPSGGRHYWYRKHPNDNHGTNVAPGKDIPWIVKLYDVPKINPGRIPYRVEKHTDTEAYSRDVTIDKSIPYEAYFRCAFIDWYNIQKLNPLWDGRYPLARAYASNIQNSDAPEDILELGPNYSHQNDIYSQQMKPITCRTIVANGYKCRYYNPTLDCCNKDRHSRSPYGLAANLKEKINE